MNNYLIYIVLPNGDEFQLEHNISTVEEMKMLKFSLANNNSIELKLIPSQGTLKPKAFSIVLWGEWLKRSYLKILEY